MIRDPTDSPLEFEPLFDLRGGKPDPLTAREAVAHPDSRTGRVYRMSAPLHLAVEIALTTGRPLLLRGDPGTGKSSLAPYVAIQLKWCYHEYVVTSTATANELQWHTDALRRLADAQTGALKDDLEYVEPGVLWWALDRPSALEHGTEPTTSISHGRDPDRAVVLIDEIDKAHPDFPNGLLVALGSHQFTVPHLDHPIRMRSDLPSPPVVPSKPVDIAPMLVVITTNEERELPPAFLRRCIIYRLEHPDADQLVEIARAHFERPDQRFLKRHEKLALAIGKRVMTLRSETAAGDHRPSTAEFLDAFRACRDRKIAPSDKDPVWQLVERATLTKPTGAAGS